MTLTNYWWLLIWIFGAGVFFFFVRPQRSEMVLGKQEWRWNIPAALLLIFPLICWAGFRSNTFGDTSSYEFLYDQMPTSISQWGTYLDGITKDKGFSVLGLIIKTFAGNSTIMYFLVIAAIQMVCIALVFRRFSCDYWLSIFIFVAATDYISWVHNGIRQFTAVAMIFAATELLLKKKYVSTILIILLASTLHQSALLMIPIIFIIQGKAWNKKTLLCIAASIIVLLFVDQFTNILDNLLSDTQYTNVVSDWEELNDNGTNPLRVLVYSIPTIFSIIGFKFIKKANDPVINLTVNAGIISTALYVISMGTSGVFMGRLPIYVSMYSMCILLPWEIKNIFTKRSASLIKILLLSGLVVFFYYQMHFSWGLL